MSAGKPGGGERAADGDGSIDELRSQIRDLSEAQRMCHSDVWRWDLFADRIIWSPHLGRVFGLESAPDYATLLSRIHPEDRTALDRRVREAIERGAPLDAEFRVLAPDGERRMRSRGTLLRDAAGRATLLCGVAREVDAGGRETDSTQQLLDLVHDLETIVALELLSRADENPRAALLEALALLRTRIAGPVDAPRDASGIRRALDRRELVLEYQPIVSLDCDRIAGMEALVRWDHPARGRIGPEAFIPEAEQSEQIGALGTWVLDHACRQAAAWRRRFPLRPALTTSVNLSARQITQSLPAVVDRALRDSGLDAGGLRLEVTESAVMGDVDGAVTILEEIKSLGVSISVDDFGTGYSSLSQLRRLPVDEVKIDRSFVAALGSGDGDSAIVAATIAMAHALSLEVVAEGVETPEQAAILRDLGCDAAQGYHFARPAAPGALEELLQHAAAGGRLPRTAVREPSPSVSSVLVVDDSPQIVRLASVSLVSAGFSVHEALTGADALAIARRVRPDCVLLDLTMEDMSGLEVCAALRNHPATRDCSILMLTGHMEARHKIDAYAAGADDYIVKPFSPRELVGRVRAALRRREAR